MSDEPDTMTNTIASSDHNGVLKPALPIPRVFRIVSAFDIAIACILLILIFVTVLWQVVGRYAPEIGWVGSGEVSRYSLVLLSFMMVSYLIGSNGHIVIELVDYVVKGKGFIALKVVSAAILALICLFLAWEALSLMIATSGRTTTVLHIPVNLLYLFPLYAFTMGAARAIYRIVIANRAEQPQTINEMS